MNIPKDYGVIVDAEFGGVPDGDVFMMEDDSVAESDWKGLLAGFRSSCESDFTEDEDYGFGDWHDNARCLYAYLYDSRFYDHEFLPNIIDILVSAERPSFAQFECYSKSEEGPSNPAGAMGDFMVFTSKVIFSQRAKESGLLASLVESP